MATELITSQMSASQTRIIDPILTSIAQGYKSPDFIGDALFPSVPVLLSGGQVLQFGKEAFMQYNIRRAPGAKTARVAFGYLGVPYAVLQDSVEVPLPRELMRDASVMPGIDLGARSANFGMRIVMQGLERDRAAIALLAANYDGAHKVALSGGSLWTANGVDPQGSIDTGREAVRASIGMYPNVMVLGPTAFNGLRNNAVLKAHFQYTSGESITEDMIAKYYLFDRVLVGKAVTSDDAGNFTDVWGNNAVMAYVPPKAEQAQEVPSYGYTYTLEGHPLVEVPYWDPTTKSWVYGVTMERAPVLAGQNAGYLIQTPA
jgi:hypothetical protein